MKFEWEILKRIENSGEYIDLTLRAKVIGGWIVRCSGSSTFKSGNNIEYASEGSMTFIPDPEHKWEIDIE